MRPVDLITPDPNIPAAADLRTPAATGLSDHINQQLHHQQLGLQSPTGFVPVPVSLSPWQLSATQFAEAQRLAQLLGQLQAAAFGQGGGFRIGGQRGSDHSRIGGGGGGGGDHLQIGRGLTGDGAGFHPGRISHGPAFRPQQSGDGDGMLVGGIFPQLHNKQEKIDVSGSSEK